ncbi:DUF202 domain-containing protein [Saccharomonospora sp. NPDC046836]|uniref:DUF202 domain-containing protein n=1 Tax=Saccharomonospora sp. NPDC046836 TaxID=3156921 RepID=UPI00340A46EE
MSTRDPGLQPERTALAWQRTGLAAGVVAVLALRNGVLHGALLDLVAGTLLVVVLLMTFILSRVPSGTGTARRLLLATVGAVVLAGVLITVQLLMNPA